MDDATARSIVAHVGRLVAEHYVFAEVGSGLARRLHQRAADGRYDRAGDAAALAALVTEDLQSANGDKHLRLLYSVDDVPADTDEAQLAQLARDATANGSGIAQLERLPGNVALLCLRPILYPPQIAGDAMVAALRLVADADALIIDLRECRGGAPDMVMLVCTYLLGNEPLHVEDFVSREGHVRQYWTLPYVPGPRFGPDKPLYVLTGPATFSGGESLSYALQQTGRATIVGERTGGGAHPREGFRVHPHLEASIPVARGISHLSGDNWEGTGVRPDVPAPATNSRDVALQLALSGRPLAHNTCDLNK
ncbi:S41 family peptidase [Dactylosporangium sp. NPDC048998]|uniref:S41 family peptidase n=1 Tax=Dactylosporangium sp. NPDC048998 TaxID=3363976 RepID=UPI00371B39E6